MDEMLEIFCIAKMRCRYKDLAITGHHLGDPPQERCMNQDKIYEAIKY